MERMSAARTIDGRAIAAGIRTAVASRIAALGFRPGLGVVLVGDDPASHLYVALKEKACLDAGVYFERRDFPADASQDAVIEAVRAFDAREDIDAVLVQLPLPPHMDADAVVSAIDAAKDVDGFHPENLMAYLEGRGSAPGLIEAISILLDAGGAPPEGMSCVLAKSAVFSAPLETMLSRRGLPPTDDCRDADVVVTALGKPGSLAADAVKPGAVVIDVGTTRIEGKTVGDADAASLEGVASALTPVPGGVGPMTVAMLLKKTLELAEARRGKS
ncbi:MAG TPA: bifunctional 5,10-methylenetetrahydrofolate dehydrogenase/5,10-methenyltetrahydrofolate cyclohydrolase [Candidatus Baltobacteraceae bacterium]|nr:bifunctional 5,10-methylenetetrahydrofolate dehydrogenase/5,10-methenyltetrahydrofolate cyclohydrolase [Candidatus Baltobacteraceae bacterium]